jgi:translation initiation factor RLI1
MDLTHKQPAKPAEHSERAGRNESIKDAVEQTMAEARMVVPGIQALFGFQLVVVFDQRFDAVLSGPEQRLHLAALILVGVAIGLIMAPAAYHRQAERRRVSEHLLRVASNFTSAALVPLVLGLSMDIYLVSRVITNDVAISLMAAGGLFVLLIGLWFVFPHLRHHGRRR